MYAPLGMTLYGICEKNFHKNIENCKSSIILSRGVNNNNVHVHVIQLGVLLFTRFDCIVLKPLIQPSQL